VGKTGAYPSEATYRTPLLEVAHPYIFIVSIIIEVIKNSVNHFRPSPIFMGNTTAKPSEAITELHF
jgi:hypothetical protein